MKLILKSLTAFIFASFSTYADDQLTLNKKDDGYRGIWYQNQPLKNQYKFKYSGGLGTYCAKHRPFSVYCPEVNKTFFCYGGVPENYHLRPELTVTGIGARQTKNGLYHMVSYFDHAKGVLPRPTVLLDKETYDAHDNPVISVDSEGYIWIFSTAHGTMRPAYVHKSSNPYSIDDFKEIKPNRTVKGKKIPLTNYSYMQVWNTGEKGFNFFFTKYEGGERKTCFATSKNGTDWDNWTQLADIEKGHYQISAVTANKAACAFNYHPEKFAGDSTKKGLNWRTNLYYMETDDFGKTWRSVDGKTLNTPVTDKNTAALIHNFEKEKLLVYLKDIVFDSNGRPIILFITSKGYKSGPESGDRTWQIARWSGKKWNLNKITASDSNYDMGSLYVDSDKVLRITAPTETGPQPGNPGGEVAMWLSQDDGQTWTKEKELTKDSEYNHTYVRRPVNAHPGFYGFWADGHGRQPSPSRLYFCNKKGDVFMLPEKMESDYIKPVKVMKK